MPEERQATERTFIVQAPSAKDAWDPLSVPVHPPTKNPPTQVHTYTYIRTLHILNERTGELRALVAETGIPFLATPMGKGACCFNVCVCARE